MVFDTITLDGVLAGGSEITFAGLFDYVSTPGDLLMEMQFLSGARMSTTLSYNRNSNTERVSPPLCFDGCDTGYTPPDYGNLTSFETITTSAVPVPAGVWMLGLGLAGLGALRRGRRPSA
ncbi:hypothetical protein AL036_14460 [Salipiger aestuarii]|uniref:VPLPA-CTERM sorting domain-containing protein n=1 Tax=Salipiger aestuarii TaxID=568098 RepID=UPI00123849A5|nr:VPLPA-CTERM sorting domain-containing protein [Salipiger aestuarii]KAA8606442.1 hypothetical protein AL036_14460 [Salipiger aestuarii]